MQLIELAQAVEALARNFSTADEASRAVMAGRLSAGRVASAEILPGDLGSGNRSTTIFAATDEGRTLSVSAVLVSRGEGGNGFAYEVVNLFACVRVYAPALSGLRAMPSELGCPEAVTEALARDRRFELVPLKSLE